MIYYMWLSDSEQSLSYTDSVLSFNNYLFNSGSKFYLLVVQRVGQPQCLIKQSIILFDRGRLDNLKKFRPSHTDWTMCAQGLLTYFP